MKVEATAVYGLSCYFFAVAVMALAAAAAVALEATAPALFSLS